MREGLRWDLEEEVLQKGLSCFEASKGGLAVSSVS